MWCRCVVCEQPYIHPNFYPPKTLSYIHTYIHTYINTYTVMHSHVNKYVLTLPMAYIHTYIHILFIVVCI